MDAIIFIDTNIFLDFYRIRSSDISLSYLDLIDKNHDKIITGNQIEMEFKKNRQKIILESIAKIKTPNWESLTPPAILSEAKPSDVIKKKKLEIAKQQKKLRDRILKILKNPATHDPVYKTLQRLFKNNSNLNLNREKKIRFTIRNLAKKRFILGYPPRKKEDNSIGDSYNWEWILKCAEASGKSVIIVSRDSDYGVIYDKEGEAFPENSYD
jgi:predicted nucleic acid-binding protein